MGNLFGPLYSLDFVVLCVCASIWFRFALLEREPPWLWAGLSVGIYAAMWLWLGWGIVACLVGQLLVAAIITSYRLARAARERE